jgi:hypothetical protein
MFDLVVCSVCLRVWRDSEWRDASQVIREVSSYDGALPRLHGAICDDCAEEISRRRADPQELEAAS